MLQQATQPLVTLDFTVPPLHGTLDQLVADPLVVSLAMVVREVLLDRVPQRIGTPSGLPKVPREALGGEGARGRGSSGGWRLAEGLGAAAGGPQGCSIWGPWTVEAERGSGASRTD